jgi:hypothetical protein
VTLLRDFDKNIILSFVKCYDGSELGIHVSTPRGCVKPPKGYMIYTGHTQKNGAVLIVNTITTAPFFCVCPVFNIMSKLMRKMVQKCLKLSSEQIFLCME